MKNVLTMFLIEIAVELIANALATVAKKAFLKIRNWKFRSIR